MKKAFFLLTGMLFVTCSLLAQPLLSNYDNPSYVNFSRYIYSPETDFHSSLRPYMISDFRKVMNYDSLRNNYNYSFSENNKLFNVVFNRNLFDIKKDDYHFTIDPLFDFQLGSDRVQQSTTWSDTRGILVEGVIGEKFAFSARIYENQAKFPLYTSSYITTNKVVPGQGMARGYGDGAFDFASSSGYISYTPGKYFNFQFGHGKHFWGDGYRSFILSDHSLDYPYFMINTEIWKIRYVNMFAQFLQPSDPVNQTTPYTRKYGSFHYLSFLPDKRLNFSVFEAVIWQKQDSTIFRGFDLNYLNPFVFYLPLEFTSGTTDNMLLGMNLSFNVSDYFTVYSQLVFDELRVSEFFSDAGWHGNKHAVQAGFKAFDLFTIPNLYLQAEVNIVRPYMYSHWKPVQNYSHFNEPLAYSFGANTKEAVAILNYNIGRVYLNAKFNIALFGLDTAEYSFGKDIFIPWTSYIGEYGNYTGQGLSTTLQQLDLSLSYLVNPSTNMNIFVALTSRKELNSEMDNRYLWIHFGFRTSLRNLYYDFY